jgi:hypothetical protein
LFDDVQIVIADTDKHELRCLDADYVDNELDELDDDEKEMAV